MQRFLADENVNAINAEGKKILDTIQENNKKIEKLSKDSKIMDYAPQIEKNGKKSAKEAVDVEKEIAAARIAAMKEGLNKTITQLEEERKQRLDKIRKSGKQYKDAEAEINKIYDGRILEEKDKWAKKMEKTYEDLWKNIESDALTHIKKMVQPRCW